MDKLKILNIFVLAFLISLIIQNWIFPKTNTNITLPSVYLSVEKEDIVIPNIPKITLHNTSSGTLIIHPCTDIIISIDGQTVSGISESAPDFCKEVTISEQQNSLISFNALYKIFASKTGNFHIELKTSSIDHSVAFTVSKPGMLRSSLATVIYEPLYNLFIALLTWIPGHSLGWAIIIITLIVRLILLVPQQHMLESQKKLQKIQPKIKAIQKEYKNDQAILGQKMMELYKEEGVNPMGSCLPLLIQMPIMIGLYWVVSGITDPSNFYHLYPLFQGFDPSKIVTEFLGINLSHIGGPLAVIAGIILGFEQWVQAFLSTHYNKKTQTLVKKDDVDPNSMEAMLNPEIMQKMMLYFLPVTLAISSYFFPLGVGLYWFIGTLFVILQQWYVNRKK